MGLLPTEINYSNYKREFVYWDSADELVDRLRLLLASKQAGNTNLNNEIMSIIEELREANNNSTNLNFFISCNMSVNKFVHYSLKQKVEENKLIYNEFGEIDINERRITNIGKPINSLDVVNKEYVDARIKDYETYLIIFKKEIQ